MNIENVLNAISSAGPGRSAAVLIALVVCAGVIVHQWETILRFFEKLPWPRARNPDTNKAIIFVDVEKHPLSDLFVKCGRTGIRRHVEKDGSLLILREDCGHSLTVYRDEPLTLVAVLEVSFKPGPDIFTIGQEKGVDK